MLYPSVILNFFLCNLEIKYYLLKMYVEMECKDNSLSQFPDDRDWVTCKLSRRKQCKEDFRGGHEKQGRENQHEYL